jgi:hypothetical protein
MEHSRKIINEKSKALFLKLSKLFEDLVVLVKADYCNDVSFDC